MKTRFIAGTLLGAAVALATPTAGQSRAFDSVTIVRSTSGDARQGLRLMPDGGLKVTNVTLRQLVDAAYQRHAFDRRQIEGGPAWMDSERFDLVAHATGGHVFEADAFPRQTWLMLQAVLEDRFNLRVRTETRQLPVYELRRVGARGPQKIDIDCGALLRMKTKDEAENGLQAGRPVCALATYQGRLVADAITMAALAGALSGTLDRPVIDRTGLAGSFAVEIEAVEIKPRGPVGPSNRPSNTTLSIFKALPEQVGLTLEPTTGPVEVLVIESAAVPQGGQGQSPGMQG